MSLIYFLNNFNNYYNRVIKRDDSIQYYIDNSQAYALRGTNNVLNYNKGPVNFNINDGITADITYNYDPNQTWQPDYILVVDDDGTTITSRWFVIEALRTRKGQYRINLRRDVVSDNYSSIINAPTFIEKATLDISNPFIFNPENMTYNQIKDPTEGFLKDSTNTPWLVGYVAAPQEEESATTIYSKFSHDIDLFYSGSINDFLESYKSGGIIYDPSEWRVSAIAEGQTLYNYAYKYKATVDGSSCTTESLGRYPNTYYYREISTQSETRNNIKNYISGSNLNNYVKNALPIMNPDIDLLTSSQVEAIWGLNGKIVQTTSGENHYLYQLGVTKIASGYNRSYTIDSSYPDLYGFMNGMSNNVFSAKGHGTSKPYKLYKDSEIYRMVITYHSIQGQYLESKTTINGSRKQLNDAPYCMFCMPFDSVTWKDTDGVTYQTNSIINMAMARSMAETLTQSKCYDLQLLPYCPRQDLIKNGIIDLTYKTVTRHYDFDYIQDRAFETTQMGIILWCSTSEGSINIPYAINVPNNNVEFKIENETTFYRLCSPNYAAQFEFKPTMNGGVTFFNVDYCYKPFQPYIHINPNFGRIYGVDTNDTRGLICAGDFCLPQTSDAYSSYVLNNKNYQESFNRQIDNMNVMHKFDMASAGLGSVSSAVSTGVGAGAATGNLAVGAVAGGLSLAGGIADQFINQAKYSETLDYTKDQFNYQLGNVQARPDTLSKVSAYNPNNKIFPFLEKYTCTEEEKEALRNKIYYNGMTVGAVGKISDYLREDLSYIKGKIIRIEDTSDDFHNVAAIAEELNKGVFLK